MCLANSRQAKNIECFGFLFFTNFAIICKNLTHTHLFNYLIINEFDNEINNSFCDTEQSEEYGILRQILRFAQYYKTTNK